MKIDIDTVTVTLLRLLKSNAPVRGKNIPGSWSERKVKNYLKPTKTSPHPGNLKNNGIVYELSGDRSQITVGGDRAVYADVTEYTSFSPGWIAKSEQQLLSKLKAAGGIVR